MIMVTKIGRARFGATLEPTNHWWIGCKAHSGVSLCCDTTKGQASDAFMMSCRDTRSLVETGRFLL